MRGAAGAAVGGAALGVARLAKRRSRPKLLGIPLPNELSPQSLGKSFNLKDVIRQIGNFAEQVEARSEEVHTLSGQAKRLTRRMT